MSEATLGQRRRAAALVAWMAAVTVVGVALHARGGGTAPAHCPAPALAGGLLRCDGRGAPVGARAWLVGARLDDNRATTAELELIPGVGPSLATSIVQARAERGRFVTIDELDDVPGVGPKTLDKLRAFLEVGP